MPKPEAPTKEDWEAHFAREERRYRDGEARLRDDPAAEVEAADPDSRQRQLTRLGNAAGGAGLSLLMLGRPGEASEWFGRAAGAVVDNHDALQSLAIVDLQLNDATSALVLLTRLVAVNPKQPALRRLLAQALVANRQPEEAVQTLEELADLALAAPSAVGCDRDNRSGDVVGVM